jgi:hypothetical protein
VVDLVEVHLVRLVEPPHANGEQADREQDEDPRIESIQPAAALAVQQAAAIRPDRCVPQSAPEPVERAEPAGVAIEIPGGGDHLGGRGRTPGSRARACRAERRRPARQLPAPWDGRRGPGRFQVVDVVLREGTPEPARPLGALDRVTPGEGEALGEVLGCVFAELEEDPAEHGHLRQRGDRDAPRRGHRWPCPSQSEMCGLS